MPDSNTYVVKVTGEILVNGKTQSDVRECLREAQLVCQASRIKFLDIERIIEQSPPVGSKEIEHDAQGVSRPSGHAD